MKDSLDASRLRNIEATLAWNNYSKSERVIPYIIHGIGLFTVDNDPIKS
jgi:hypothetical protein